MGVGDQVVNTGGVLVSPIGLLLTLPGRMCYGKMCSGKMCSGKMCSGKYPVYEARGALRATRLTRQILDAAENVSARDRVSA